MEAIDSLDRDLTIVQIAHRLTTLRNCDFIVGARPRPGGGAGVLTRT